MVVHGAGPRPARVLILGERPGQFEASTGTPFHPKAPVGKELTRYLREVLHLHRDQVFLTNLIRTFEPKRTSKREKADLKTDIRRWEVNLKEELRTVKPELIVSLGREATRYLLGDVNLEDVYGLPHRWNGSVVVPNYLRLYDTDIQPVVWYSFKQCQRVLAGELTPHEPDCGPAFHYVEARTASEVDWLRGHRLAAIDTEGLAGSPWGLSAAVRPRSATVVRATSSSALDTFRQHVPDMRVILHNSLHDLAVLRDLGIEVRRFEDTMILAGLLCLEPQGLKSLAYRYRGIERQSYEEVVAGPQRIAAIQWLRSCAKVRWADFGIGGSDREWGMNRRIDNILGIYEGEVRLLGENSRYTMAFVRKMLDDKGVSVGKQNPARTGWIDCLVPAYVYDELSSDGHYDVSGLVQRDCAEDPGARWKVVCREYPRETDIVEHEMGPMPEPGLEAVDDKTAVNYSAGDADDTFTIYPILKKQIEDLKLTEAYELDLGVVPMIDRMMSTGFMADREYFQKLGEELRVEMEMDLAEVRRVVGHDVNPGSSKQVATLLFDELHLPVQQYTAEHERSTADEVIEALRLISDHPVLPLISDYRELAKMKGTYADKLWRWLGPDGRIHPRLRITRVPSGRLACSEPNLMAIPVRSQRMLNGRKLGKAVRDGFTAKPGCVLGSWDLDQIEMRVLADRSADPTLIDVFLSGQDIHQKTASLVFDLPMDQVAKGTWQRDSAKSVGFGIVYGITAKGLQLQLKLRSIHRTEPECQEMIDAYLVKAYPGVRWLMESKITEARRDGFVRSMLGRIRYLPGIHASNNRLRSESERICLNHDIQTTAQEVEKLGMVGIWERVLPLVHAEGWYCEPILQIHDELILEVDERVVGEVDAMVRNELQYAVRLSVPIGAKGSFATSWGGLK